MFRFCEEFSKVAKCGKFDTFGGLPVLLRARAEEKQWEHNIVYAILSGIEDKKMPDYVVEKPGSIMHFQDIQSFYSSLSGRRNWGFEFPKRESITALSYELLSGL